MLSSDPADRSASIPAESTRLYVLVPDVPPGKFSDPSDWAPLVFGGALKVAAPGMEFATPGAPLPSIQASSEIHDAATEPAVFTFVPPGPAPLPLKIGLFGCAEPRRRVADCTVQLPAPNELSNDALIN